MPSMVDFISTDSSYQSLPKLETSNAGVAPASFQTYWLVQNGIRTEDYDTPQYML